MEEKEERSRMADIKNDKWINYIVKRGGVKKNYQKITLSIMRKCIISSGKSTVAYSMYSFFYV